MRLSCGSPGFGKVIRVEGDDVLLIPLTQDEASVGMECSQRAYRADFASLIRKTNDEVIYPVDAIYNSEKCFYELLTRLDDIDRLLK